MLSNLNPLIFDPAHLISSSTEFSNLLMVQFLTWMTEQFLNGICYGLSGCVPPLLPMLEL